MRQKPRCACSSNHETNSFPVLATVAGVASCFAEPILQKYFALGSGVDVALALGQAVPFALVLRYLAARLNRVTSATDGDNLH